MQDKSTLLLVGNYPPPFGGISVHLQALAEKINALPDYEVIQFDIEPGVEEKESVRRATGRMALLLQLAKQIRRCVIVHFHTNGHNGKSWFLVVFVALLAAVFRKRAILTLHSGNCPAYLKTRSPFCRSSLLFSARRYRKIVVVNQELHSFFLKAGFGEKLELIPAYLGLRCEPSSLESPSFSNFIEKHTPLWTTILAFRAEYGLETISQFCSLAIEEFPDFGLVMMGPKDGSEKWLEEMSSKGLANHLFLSGELPAGEIYSVLQKGDCFLRTTLYDGDAISVREALSLGVPVVASDNGYRPSGVLTYSRGNAKDLLRKIEEVSACSATICDAEPVEEKFFARLVAAYRE